MKDEDQFEDAIRRRVFTVEDGRRFRAAGAEAVERLRSAKGRFDRWAAWLPPRHWTTAALPTGWTVA